MERSHTFREFLKNICVFIFVVALLLCVASLALAVFSGNDDGSHTVFGYRFTIMKSDSMNSVVPNSSLMLSKAYDNPTADDIVLFNGEDGSLCVAKLVSFTEIDGKNFFVIKSETSSNAVMLSADTPIEKVIFTSRSLGVFVNFFTSFYPFILCVLLIILEIYLSISGRKKRKEQDETVKAENQSTIGESKKPARRVKEQSPLNTLIEEQKKHRLNSLQTEEDISMSVDEARLIFADKEDDRTLSSDTEDENIPLDLDSLVDDILEEVN